MQEQGKGAADIGSGNLPVEYSPQPWKGSDFKWHPVAHLISRQKHCHLHKTIIIKQSFASAHVSKPHFTDITVQVSFVLLRADSFEKDSSVTCKSQLWLSQEKWNRRTKENLWQTNFIIAFLSVGFTNWWSCTTGLEKAETPRDLKEKCYRSSVYKNHARTIWKSLFPPLKCSHLQHGICQIFNSSQLGPEKTFPFHSWDYCANKKLLYKVGTLCPLHLCRCAAEREPKSFSSGNGSCSSDMGLPLLYKGKSPWLLGLKRFAGLLSLLNQAFVQPLSHRPAPSRKEANLHLEVLRSKSWGETWE